MLHLGRGKQYDGLKLREYMAVGTLHRALILEVGSITHAADYCRGTHTSCLVACKRGVGHHLHALLATEHILHKAFASLGREHPTLLGVYTDGHDDPIEEPERLINYRLVPAGEWVKRPGKYCNTLHTYIY